MKKISIGRKWKYGSMAILLSLVVVAAIIVGNVGVTLLTEKLGWKVDMTSDNRYEISDATVELLGGLKEHITMYVIATEQEMRTHKMYNGSGGEFITYGDEIVETLKKYETVSNGMVDVQFVDVGTNPQFLEQFVGLGTIDPYSVIVTSQRGGYQVLQLHQLYYWYYAFDQSYTDGVDPIGINVERSVASAILYVDEENKRQAAFIECNGEGTDRGLFVNFLELNNFECYSVNLLNGDFKENTDLVVILGPKNDYTTEEIARLEKFLKGKNTALIVALDATAKELPELTRFLSDYGVDISRNTVYDTRVSSGATNISAILSSDEEMFDFMPSSYNVIMPYSLSLTLNDSLPKAYSSRVIATSSESAFARSGITNDPTIVKKDSDLNGPFNIACIAEAGGADMEGNIELNKILFLSSPYALYDEYFTSAKYNNQEFMQVILNDFFDTANLSAFEGKEFTIPSVLLLNWEKQACLIALSVIPLALLVAGIVIWFRRKNK